MKGSVPMTTRVLSLADLHPGQSGYVISLRAEGAIRRRLLDLGLVPGTKVQALFTSPSGDPVAYAIRGAIIALRLEGARQILLQPTN